ncbi:RAD52 family DNA repair protein [Streptomyces sp. NBC_01221]|uniref:Rad52/Rad22 family DNA repair protein n=1 Tax=Streptomyces sp. NBC_01221 TaxID=2903782 RepID=UPI00224DE78C|nr:Rad52/Rad22 family DNA repair protein [Streptomyces sp. NBC_01221]MCX4792466.1 RAD52 family DNA repair protein [Streptomyces sp. NBC_01221]
MATAVEAPASITAEGPTSHTQNQLAARLTAPQLRLLHRPLDPKRVGRDDKGFSHMEAWDIKRYLLRVFGFAGYDTENRELALVREIETPNGNRSKWTVVYRAQVRLIVKDVQGRVIGYWDGEAAGAGNNLPNLADSHDMAMKTATSQALKRAATHLGDAFGLSLYNNGSAEPVVRFSAAHPPEQWEKQAAPLPEPDDPPVQPEPGTQQDGDESTPAPAPAAATGRDYLQEARAAADAETVRTIYRAAQNDGAAPEYLAQIAELGKAKGSPAAPSTTTPAGPDPIGQLLLQVQRHWGDFTELTKDLAEAGRRNQLMREVEGPVGGWVPFGDMVTARIAELKEQARQAEQNGPQRSAA